MNCTTQCRKLVGKSLKVEDEDFRGMGGCGGAWIYAFYDGRWLLVVEERLARSDTPQLIIA